jgi:pilus assembly protein Flp/PilA
MPKEPFVFGVESRAIDLIRRKPGAAMGLAWPMKARSVAARARTAMQERLMTMIRRFLSDEGGATAIEYALLAALISVAVIAAMQSVATQLNTVFSEVSTNLK